MSSDIYNQLFQHGNIDNKEHWNVKEKKDISFFLVTPLHWSLEETKEKVGQRRGKEEGPVIDF